ncbi:MAG: chorismate mutase [Alphaproteobacteria bacterium]|nr:chorismate mutase [Alphaproteobacteria bacterium]
MSDPTLTTDQQKLSQVRAEIDALDARILNAIEERAALAAQVAAAKSGQHTFRPGREADLVRNLVASSALPPQLIERIWRQIIAGNLSSQAPLKITIPSSPDMRIAAGFRFGPGVALTEQRSGGEVVGAIANGSSDLGIVPHWDDDATWLDALIAARADGQHVFISAVTPLLEGHGIADGVVLASILPDPSQADVTVTSANGTLALTAGHHPQADGLLGIIQQRHLS